MPINGVMYSGKNAHHRIMECNEESVDLKKKKLPVMLVVFSLIYCNFTL